MEVTRSRAQPGGDGLYFRPTKPKTNQVRHDLEGIWIIYQAKLLDPLDLDGWVEIFETTVSNLLSTQPLQSLTKRARLGVVMSIVGSGRTHLHTPAVLAVLATDWSDEWASFKLLQDTVRQASLSRLRSEWGFNPSSEFDVPRKRMADLVFLGAEKTVASWRAVGIGGSARVERFTQALIAWGQEHLGASKPTIFDQAFPFLGLRQIQASRSRADARRVPVPLETRHLDYTGRPPSPAVCGPSVDVMDEADTQTETSRWEEGEGKEAEKSVGSRKRRKIGPLLRLDEGVIVRKKGASGDPDLWRRGAIETCREDGTYDVRYDDDGEVGHLVRTQDILCPEESDVPTGMLTPHDTTIAHRSPLKRRQTISWASADGVSSLSPCRPVSEEYTTPESTSPRTTTDDEDDSWCVTGVDDDDDSGDEGIYTRLIQRRNRKRRVLHDDECEDNDNDSTTAASDAATAARDRHARQAGLSRFVDNDGESSQPPLLCTGRARSKGAIGLQAGQERAANKGASGKQGGSCDGFRPGEIESEIAYREELAHDDIESGTEGVDGEDDETDEELAEETCGETLEEEDVETEGEVEAGKWGTRGDRRQPQEEDSEADADGVGKGVNNLADDVVRSSPPPANEMPREILQQVERSTERASAQHLEKDNEENTGMLSVEEERSHGAGAAQSDFAPPSPVVPSMIQGTTDTDGGQDCCSEHRHEASPRDEGTRNVVINRVPVVDNQSPGRPTHFMRVYGSAGITRVRESMAAWFSHRRLNS